MTAFLVILAIVAVTAAVLVAILVAEHVSAQAWQDEDAEVSTFDRLDGVGESR